MRVTQKMIYDSNLFSVGTVADELAQANTVVSTGKRINSLSDDPIGLTQVLDLRSSLQNLDQIERNITTGRTWLSAAETALSSAKDVISDAKVLCVAMKSETINETQRADAITQVDGMLQQLITLANSSVNNQYIMAGTRTDIKPFEMDDENDPTMVTYGGNGGQFSIKTGETTTLAVGFDGRTAFDGSVITIDDSNNSIDFMEDAGAGFGVELTAVIPEGQYTRSELAAAVETAMQAVSTVAYDVTYDETAQSFTIQDDGTLSEFKLLWASGTNAGTSPAALMGFASDTDAQGGSSYTGESGVQWGVFRTLLDLRGYLASNDIEGIGKCITALDENFNQIVSTISGIGSKGVYLDVKESIISDLRERFNENMVKLEDADLIEAVTQLKTKEMAYEAVLASSARIMQISLLDYI